MGHAADTRAHAGNRERDEALLISQRQRCLRRQRHILLVNLHGWARHRRRVDDPGKLGLPARSQNGMAHRNRGKPPGFFLDFNVM